MMFSIIVNNGIKPYMARYYSFEQITTGHDISTFFRAYGTSIKHYSLV